MTQPGTYDSIGNFRDDQNNKHITQQNLAYTMDSNKQGNGASESPYYIGDYTFPQWMCLQGGLTGSVGTQTAGTAHTHPLNTGFGLFTQNYTLAVNNTFGGYITITRPMIVDIIAFSAYMVTSSAGGSILFQIYRENPSDGSLTQVSNSSIKAGVPVATPGAIFQLQLDVPMIVSEGERYLARIANLTSPSVSLGVTGLQYNSSAPAPDTMHNTTTSTLANQTSFTATEATTARNNGIILPWIAFGQHFTSAAIDQVWWDDFNRILLGPWWFLAHGNGATADDLAIVNNRLAYTGTTDGLQQAFHIRPTSTDSMRAELDVHGLNTDGTIILLICCDRTFLTGSSVGLAIEDDVAIITTTAIGGGITTRATYTSGSNEGTWSIYYEPTPDKYTVLKNGEQVMTWTDSSHVIPHGVDYRYSAVQIECDSGIPGGTCDNWVFKDWAP